ncbi:MAG: DUF294 nucleotidyltransferase-like domain-containing protein [Planctomycetaceae bacterium]
MRRVVMLRFTPDQARELLLASEADERLHGILADIGFRDIPSAVARLQRLGRNTDERARLADTLPALLLGLQSAHAPDQSLLNLERLVDVVPNRRELFQRLADHPRQAEILLRLFVSSQFLSEILLRNPEYLPRLTQHQRLAEIKWPPQFAAEAAQHAALADNDSQRLHALRRYQQWELLRLAACDTFHLMDLRTVTQQLSWLADALIHNCLQLASQELQQPADNFAVVAFGKLGAEELNYSSDVDLVFVVRKDAEHFWKLGQRLIAALSDATESGFLYRVDMRLRPWGKSGPLVTTAEAYLDYLVRHARPWELQALLKARTVAGSHAVGQTVLDAVASLLGRIDVQQLRTGIRDQLAALRPQTMTAGDLALEVKTGPGGIRDIEFLTQYLQIACHTGDTSSTVRSTLEALVRLADAESILPGEYQHLSSAYLFQRSVEHSLQLMHNRQRYTLPRAGRELDYLAGRLDFQTADQFLRHYHEHRRCVQEIVAQRLSGDGSAHAPVAETENSLSRHLGQPGADLAAASGPEVTRSHLQLLEQLSDDVIVATKVEKLTLDRWELTVVGYDVLGDLSLMCGLLVAEGLNIETGYVLTGAQPPLRTTAARPFGRLDRRPKYVNTFVVSSAAGKHSAADWQRYRQRLTELLQLAANDRLSEAQGKLARQIEPQVLAAPRSPQRLQPLEIAIENDRDDSSTVLLIRGDDTPGFLYELCSALATSEVSIQRMRIESQGRQVTDVLHVTTADGQKITDPQRLQELRAAIVLTKHFTHLLPTSANPRAALTHFRELLQDLFQQQGWLGELVSLQQPEVLSALVKLFGESDFLWEDFLRLHHSELLPLMGNVTEVSGKRDPDAMRVSLDQQLEAASGAWRTALNHFKDRQMFRIDMRHILDPQQPFGTFSQELTSLAELVIQAAVERCSRELHQRYGSPRGGQGELARLSVCGLGKFGGRELGFASDIELLFLFDIEGQTDGSESISNSDFFARLVESCKRSIHARQQGIFEIDLRLRPYGSAGSLAVARSTFERYYDPDGPSWPFERQSLVKLRPVAGDVELGREIVAVRDRLIYSGRPFDLHAMRGLRERQMRELVQAGGFNAKLSPGGLVDCEYFVQALQITFGSQQPALRTPNTRDALRALESAGIIRDRLPLRNAYRFLRRLIDALRMVRGNARDLAVPARDSDQYDYLARRLDYGANGDQLAADLTRSTTIVLDHVQQLDQLIATQAEHSSFPLPPAKADGD